jgi:hypothetical protein
MNSDTPTLIFGACILAGIMFGFFVLGTVVVLHGHVRVELSYTPFPEARP